MSPTSPPAFPTSPRSVRRETGRASIGFPGAKAAVAFLDALANGGPRDGFYERMAHWASPAAWQLVLGIQDWGLKRDEEQGHDGDEQCGRQGVALDGTPLSHFAAVSLQVRFPRSDVDEMTGRMRRHNRGEVVALGRPSWAAITVPDEEQTDPYHRMTDRSSSGHLATARRPRSQPSPR